jgi:antitoxin HigA-1
MTNGASVSSGKMATHMVLKLLITIEDKTMSKLDVPPIHPGDHLAEFLEEFDLSQYRLAKEIDVSPRRINEIIHGKRSVTADTALRLSRFFNTTPEFWMNLQSRFELESERERLEPVLYEIHPVVMTA